MAFCRDADPGDLQSLQSMHFDMFPVDYEDSFFERVAYHQDGLENLTAVSRCADLFDDQICNLSD